MKLGSVFLTTTAATTPDPLDPASSASSASDVRSPLVDALDRLERARALDGIAGRVRTVVRALPLGSLRDVLRGRQVGHPLHPALVQVPVGAWLSSAVMDLVPGGRRGARVLVGVGTVAAVPAALAGWVDWAEQNERQLRTGLVHAGCNAAAVSLYAASWVARGRRPGTGRLLGLAGLVAAGTGGLIGGHMAYRQAAGANKSEPVPHLVEPGWHVVGRTADLPLGEPVRRLLGEVPLLVVRGEGDRVDVLADRCAHASGPLSEGEVADGCVTCPWHGSVFRLSDGRNVAGPATAPQPCFETRVDANGTVSVRLPDAG